MKANRDKYLDFAYSLVGIREPGELMDVMLRKLRRFLNADAGSIYIYSEEEDCLVFKYTQNDTVSLPFEQFFLQLNNASIAGYAGLKREIVRVDDVNNISRNLPFSYNNNYDKISGYRTKSVLAIPLVSAKDELVGVLQLINKRPEASAPLADDFNDNIIPFTDKDESVSYSLSGIMAISLENSILYSNIEKMWEGFARASIQAIEARDPVTRGHTERVTRLSLAFLKNLNDDIGVFEDFSVDKEIFEMFEYACLLHDFGKIGVRENVLNKSKKLLPEQLDAIKWRIEAGKVYQSDLSDTFDQCWNLILKANEPKLLDEDVTVFFEGCGCVSFEHPGYGVIPVLTKEEIETLAVRKGSLNSYERKEIESHVLHTYNYLTKIPWPAKFKQIPYLSCMHHEKEDGSGYPFGLCGDQIDILGKIMGVADIFDALTAKDRPYKTSLPVKDALKVLEKEAEKGKLNKKLVAFFVEKEIYSALQEENGEYSFNS